MYDDWSETQDAGADEIRDAFPCGRDEFEDVMIHGAGVEPRAVYDMADGVWGPPPPARPGAPWETWEKLGLLAILLVVLFFCGMPYLRACLSWGR